jgi:pimeloyl-ACP methyl ester carboxylesterase
MNPNFAMPTLGGKQLWGDRYVYGGWRVQQNVVTGHCRLLGPEDVRHAWGTLDACMAAFQRLRGPLHIARRSDHLVLLLHGIFRSKESLRPMERAMRRAGFEAAALNYPSTRRGLDEHAEQVGRLLDSADDVTTVSLVGHSMGGIVARLVLATPAEWQKRLHVHRLVTIGTPNRGAEVVDRLRHLKTFQALAGPAGLALGTDAGDWPAPACRFGVIAGARGDGRGWNPMIPGDDDMTVSLASALLEGAEDTLVVPGAIHTFLPQRPDVIQATIRYLATGRFDDQP